MTNRTRRTPEKRAIFLGALRDGKSVSGACAEASVPRRTVYDWRDADSDFKATWEDALEAGTDRMEDEALRRAVEGTLKPVFHGGKKVGTIREYSDTLIIFLLKARRPKKFRENTSGEAGAEDDMARARRIKAALAEIEGITDAPPA